MKYQKKEKLAKRTQLRRALCHLCGWRGKRHIDNMWRRCPKCGRPRVGEA